MNRARGFLLAATLLLTQAQFRVVTPAGSHFMQVPFLPPCMQVALVQGNPRAGASIQLARISPGCVIPPHWHTANTRLIFISGYGTHQVKGQPPAILRSGAFVFLPAHQIHWFRCANGCVVYNLQDGRDIVHWVDSKGHDIPLTRAFSH